MTSLACLEQLLLLLHHTSTDPPPPLALLQLRPPTTDPPPTHTTTPLPQLDVPALNDVYGLADTLQHPPKATATQGPAQSVAQACVAAKLSELLAVCGAQLVALFGRLPDTLTRKDLLAQFQQLCAPAVLALLRREDLSLDSENCVLLLLDAWMRGPRGCGGLEPATHAELAGCVRVWCLDRTFLLRGLPRLPWFELTKAQRAGLVHFASLPRDEQARYLVHLQHLHHPLHPHHHHHPQHLASTHAPDDVCVYQPPRKGLVARDGSGDAHAATLELELSRDKMSAAALAVAQTRNHVVVKSTSALVSGHCLVLSCSLHPPGTSSYTPGMWLGLRLSGGAGRSGIASLQPLGLGVSGIAVLCQRADVEGGPSGSASWWPARGLGACVADEGGAWGFRGFLGGLSSPADYWRGEDWVPALHEGRLRVQARVSWGG